MVILSDDQLSYYKKVIEEETQQLLNRLKQIDIDLVKLNNEKKQINEKLLINKGRYQSVNYMLTMELQGGDLKDTETYEEVEKKKSKKGD